MANPQLNPTPAQFLVTITTNLWDDPTTWSAEDIESTVGDIWSAVRDLLPYSVGKTTLTVAMVREPYNPITDG